MIVPQDVSWIRMLFSVHGTGLRRTLPRIVAITLFSVVVTVLARHTNVEHYTLTATPFTLIGLALGIFLGFRNNVAYDRYWEGRKLWGSLVNVSRSLARQTQVFIHVPASLTADSQAQVAVATLQRDSIYRAIAFCHSLRAALRGQDAVAEAQPWLPAPDMLAIGSHHNTPQAILLALGGALRDGWRKGWIQDVHLSMLESSLVEMTAIQGACERIKNTPVPYAYSVLLHQIVAFYCLFLSFGIVDQVGSMTPVVVMLISHAFFGLDEIGDEIEEPFGLEPNHLPLSTLCATIEMNLRQLAGDADVPAVRSPAGDVHT